jgi:hypothetical protein
MIAPGLHLQPGTSRRRADGRRFAYASCAAAVPPRFTSGSNDIDLTLQTTCNRRVDHAPDGTGSYVDAVCDPTGGFSFTPNTIENFGTINFKRGHRVIELAAKYYF